MRTLNATEFLLAWFAAGSITAAVSRWGLEKAWPGELNRYGPVVARIWTLLVCCFWPVFASVIAGCVASSAWESVTVGIGEWLHPHRWEPAFTTGNGEYLECAVCGERRVISDADSDCLNAEWLRGAPVGRGCWRFLGGRRAA